MSIDTCTELAQAFIGHFNDRTDSSGIWATDAVVWNNLTGTEQAHGATEATSDALRAAIPSLRWDEVAINSWPDGFCVQYTFTGTLPDGTAVRVPSCGVADVRDGVIVRFSEYLDGAQVAPVGQALLASLQDAGAAADVTR